MLNSQPSRVWSVAEAKNHLPEILRLAEVEGPQRICAEKSFVVVPEMMWLARGIPGQSLGKWLVENAPRGVNLEPPNRSSSRPIPFGDETDQ